MVGRSEMLWRQCWLVVRRGVGMLHVAGCCSMRDKLKRLQLSPMLGVGHVYVQASPLYRNALKVLPDPGCAQLRQLTMTPHLDWSHSGPHACSVLL